MPIPRYARRLDAVAGSLLDLWEECAAIELAKLGQPTIAKQLGARSQAIKARNDARVAELRAELYNWRDRPSQSELEQSTILSGRGHHPAIINSERMDGETLTLTNDSLIMGVEVETLILNELRANGQMARRDIANALDGKAAPKGSRLLHKRVRTALARLHRRGTIVSSGEPFTATWRLADPSSDPAIPDPGK